MRRPYMVMGAVAHIFDIYSDLSYIVFVPSYAIEFKIIMILSFAMPIFIMFVLYRCCFVSKVVTRIGMLIFYLGLGPIYYECVGTSFDKQIDVGDTFVALQGIFFLIFEDGP